MGGDGSFGSKQCRASSTIKSFTKQLRSRTWPYGLLFGSSWNKNLAFTMDAHSKNAMKVAQFLSQQEIIDKVYYPGLASHKGHDIARKQMKKFGGMLSFSLKNDDINAAKKIVENTTIFYLAE